MRIALCQFNPVVGAIFQNAQRIKEFILSAQEKGAELVIFPELAICGYPPKDLLFRREMLDQIQVALQSLAGEIAVPAILGAPVRVPGKDRELLWNAAVLCWQGKVETVARKRLLPNYGVFDEHRYFVAGEMTDGNNVVKFKGLNLGFSICEDAWSKSLNPLQARYKADPVADIVREGADIIVNISASPFSAQKPLIREKLFSELARCHQRPLLMVGQVGANDQLIFDGHSLLVDAGGVILARSELFAEGFLLADIDAQHNVKPVFLKSLDPLPSAIELISSALILGVKDYVQKCGAPGVIVGLSGGVDSAVTATLAVRALGADRVVGVRMPSHFSSRHSLEDAEVLAFNLGIRLLDIPIEPMVEVARKSLTGSVHECESRDLDIMDQNLQARARGVLLMALSNSNHFLLLSTGNKSELAMGYATLYGDMCGALAPLGDVYKTDVWRLARFLNQTNACIPENTITKVPSAELKENQCDQDTLPPYDVLDQVLFQLIEREQTVFDIAENLELAVDQVRCIAQSVFANDYKRRQAAVILMVSEKVFGDGRRWPIAKHFHCNATVV